MADPLPNITIVGLGLIGSSIALALRRAGLAGRIIGYDTDPDVCARADKCGFCDSISLDPDDAVADADVVFLSIPVGACGAAAQGLSPAMKPGAILTDTGSVKTSVMADVAPRLAEGVIFVPGHPIAGSENSGPEAGFVEIFDGRWCILTPDKTTPTEAVETVASLWRGMGSFVDVMPADHHDLVLAITSHLPHLIAFNIVGTAADLEEVTRSEVIKYSAGGFRDFTRIAASDPIMWRDVFLNNREAVLEALGRFSEDLSTLQRAIRVGDGDKLFELFTRTRAIRRYVIEAGQDTAEADFGRPHGPVDGVEEVSGEAPDGGDR